MLRPLRNIGRIWQIARTLARFDALHLDEERRKSLLLRLTQRVLSPRRPRDLDNKRLGERLVMALDALGPVFIKLGQALSVRADFLGEEMASDLSALQDRLPPFPGSAAIGIIEAELGKPVDQVFNSLDGNPVAAASIAQVHKAVTTDGTPVAVKVLRPNIERALFRDFELLLWLARAVERLRPELRRLKPLEVVESLRETVEIELDLRFEAAAADELRLNFADDETFKVPVVDWSRTSRRVMTTEWIDGIPIDERDALLAADHDLEAIIANMAKVLFLQVFRDGFFHADLHPGNLFVAENGAIVAVDFGIMGRLDTQTRRFLAEMLLGFITGDYRKVADVHVRAGYVPANQSVDAFAQAARSIAEPIFGLPLNQISIAELLMQLFQITQRFDMETQPQLLLLQKTMLVAEGVGRSLRPETNMWALARPLIEGWMREGLSPETRIRETLSETVAALERLPGLLQDLEGSVGSLNRGGLKLDNDSLRVLAENRRSRLGAWPIWAGIAAAVAVIASLGD